MQDQMASHVSTDMLLIPQSQLLSEKIAKIIPGGVNSPFRSFKEVGGHTIFFARASGARLVDVDGNSYIDYLGAWGPAILGHCPPTVVEACQKAIALGAVFGAPHEFELELAELLVKIIPNLEKVRFVNSGAEAVMSAVRLARGYTGRNLLVMFEGCYHGHSDVTLAAQGWQDSTAMPGKGIAEGAVSNTVLLPFNDLEALSHFLSLHKQETAAVLLEPVPGAMGVISPVPGYLQSMAELCLEANVLLIFDEVLSGFRVALGGAQELYNVNADLICFGKALGGGMPIGAYGGRKKIMDCLEPIGTVYQAGTFSGNPVTMAGAIETIRLLEQGDVYQTLEARTAQLFTGLSDVIKEHNLPVQLQRVGSLFSIIFASSPVNNFQDSLAVDSKTFAQFFHYLLNKGIYLPPSAVDAACVSAAHSEEDIELTVSACRGALHSMQL